MLAVIKKSFKIWNTRDQLTCLKETGKDAIKDDFILMGKQIVVVHYIPAHACVLWTN